MSGRAYLLAILVGTLIGSSVFFGPLSPVLLAGLGVGGALLIITKPIHLLHLVVILTPFTVAIPAGSFIPALGPYDLLLGFATGLILVSLLLARRRTSLPPILIGALIAFAFGTSIGPLFLYVARGDALALPDVISLLAPLKFLLVFWVFAAVPLTPLQGARLLRSMVIAAAVVSVIGLLQAAHVRPVVELISNLYPSAQTASSSELGRVTSVLGAWNSLGLFLLTALMIIAATIADQQSLKHRRLLVGSAALVLACLLATNLYSGVIGAIFGLIIMKTADPRGLRSLVPLVLVSLMGALFLLPTIIQRAEMQFEEVSWVPQTLRFRYQVWTRYYIPAIVEEPLIGVKPTFGDVPFPYPESQYIYFLYRSGVFSLIGHVVWVATTLAWLVGVRRRQPPGPSYQFVRSVALIPIVLIIVSSVIGVINPVFTYTASMTFFWIILGMILSFQGGAHRAAP